MNGFERYTKKTRRQVFLEEMEQVVPWREVCALIEPHYPKPGNGRPPVGVERMLRIYFLQGLKKNAHQLFVICGLVNLFLSRQKLLTASA
jgi:hypothetical protein